MWKYCPTDSNPAILLTRGMFANKFKPSTLKTGGPKWITVESITYKWTIQNYSEEFKVEEH